jgi:Heterokaryon incompatibility protein (HET)
VIIGGELFTAQRRFRWYKRTYSEDEPLMLWVDALCTNQNDMSERKKHVKRIGQIYAKARQVIIWLGEEISNAERSAFGALEAINHRFTEM